MRFKKFPLLAAVALAVVPLTGTTAQNGMPSVPIDVWALRDTIATMDISPDGQHLMVLRMPSKDGEYIMEIFKTEDLSKTWRTLKTKIMTRGDHGSTRHSRLQVIVPLSSIR